MVDARAAGDRKQPGRKRPPPAVAVQILIGAEKRLLRQVFGVGAQTPMPQELQHRGLESPQQLLEARRASPLRSAGEFFVARRR